MCDQPNLIHISIAKAYKYKSLLFTFHDYLGPEFLRHKDHELTTRKISLRQWGEFAQWLKLNKIDREVYRIN